MKKKLIRDKYVLVIENERLDFIDKVAEPEKFEKFLLAKVQEEWDELAETKFSDIEEWADVYEVFCTLAHFHGFSEDDIHKKAIEKTNDKGGFNNGVLLKL